MRRAAVLNYFVDGTRSCADEPLLEGMPSYGIDGVMDGHFNPIVFDQKWLDAAEDPEIISPLGAKERGR